MCVQNGKRSSSVVVFDSSMASQFPINCSVCLCGKPFHFCFFPSSDYKANLSSAVHLPFQLSRVLAGFVLHEESQQNASSTSLMGCTAPWGAVTPWFGARTSPSSTWLPLCAVLWVQWPKQTQAGIQHMCEYFRGQSGSVSRIHLCMSKLALMSAQVHKSRFSRHASPLCHDKGWSGRLFTTVSLFSLRTPMTLIVCERCTSTPISVTMFWSG